MQKIVAVPFHTIRVGKWVDFDIYAYDKDQNLQKIVKKDQLYSGQTRTKLARAQLTNLFIHSHEKEAYYNYLERNLKEMAVDKSVPLPEKTRALYDGSARILENIFFHPEDGELHKKVKGIVQSAVDIVQFDPRAIKTLKEVGSPEYSNQTHSVDTAVISLGLGKHLGFNRNDLSKLGYAAIMHDIGKSRIDRSILEKEGELSEDEFDLVKRHSLFGYFILRKQEVTDEDILGGVRFHHEKSDGSGYPEKRIDSEIPLFAKIIAMADVFSALSTNRYHKSACSSYEALVTMKDEMINGFDKRLLLEFIRFMGPKSS